MIIAYLINQYPQPSHTFIRREIQALELQGLTIRRFTLRLPAGESVDADDRAETAKTRVVLKTGALSLGWATLQTALTRPGKFLHALALTGRIGRRSPRGLAAHLAYLAEACILRKWFGAEQVEHVHAHFGTNSTMVAMLCRVLGGPQYSFTCHGPEEFDMPLSLGLGEKIRRARFVVAVSEFGRSQLFRWAPRQDWEKIHVIHCGLDQSFLPPRLTTPPGEGRLLNVGRLAEQKGQLLLLEAAAMLQKQGVEFQLVIVGDGPLREALQQSIGRLGLGERVRLTGWLDNAGVRQEMIRSRALVLPSFAEGLPVVIMESLALGRPVIASAIAGIPELVQPGISGWLTPPGSASDLAEAMRQALAAPPEQLAKMGRTGAQIVAQRHDVKIEAGRLAGLFKNPATAAADAGY